MLVARAVLNFDTAAKCDWQTHGR